MSAGSRSLVNWIRRKEQPRERARLWASVVFPTPGTSSIRRCPRANRATAAISTTAGLPLMTRSMLLLRAWILWPASIVWRVYQSLRRGSIFQKNRVDFVKTDTYHAVHSRNPSDPETHHDAPGTPRLHQGLSTLPPGVRADPGRVWDRKPPCEDHVRR